MVVGLSCWFSTNYLTQPQNRLPNLHLTTLPFLKMTSDELKKQVAKKTNLPLEKASQLVEAWLASLTESLVNQEPVTFSGFGTFLTIHYPSKTIWDPRGRGHKIIMLPTNVVKFRPSEQLRERTKNKFPNPPEKLAEAPDHQDKSQPGESQEKPKLINFIKKAIHFDEAQSEAIQQEEQTNQLVNSETLKTPTEKPAEYQRQGLSSKQVNIQFRDISNIKIEKEVLNLIPVNIAKKYKVAPIALEAGKLTVAMVDPENINTIELLKKTTELEIEPVLSTSDEINSILDQYTMLQEEVEDVIAHSDLGITSKELKQAEKEKLQKVEEVEDSPTIRIVFSLLKRAVRERASDVHVEPQEESVIVRFRVDGILQKRVVLPKAIQASVLARLKIMANLKIDEQRLPQDGRFQLNVDGQEVDFRFSTMPCVNGEKAVMRILDKSQGILSLEEIGVTDRGFEILSRNIKKSHGMTLVTGPTGSGKTTTLYAVLGKLMNSTVNIVTLEDPVEYRIAEINQSQINSEIGYSFASSLRTVVRQDPDIIMLGEIRDKETAEMAIHAALTGHIVLSTLHTNDAAGAIPRLIDMSIEPFLISSSVNTVVAQRLTRKLCQKCRQSFQPSELEMKDVRTALDKIPKEMKDQVNKIQLSFYQPKGCDECNNTGYKGRIGVFEVLDVNESIRELIITRASSDKIQTAALAQGMITMLQDGILKAIKGVTSLEEVWRVTRE